jgi:hypothetical protein
MIGRVLAEETTPRVLQRARKRSYSISFDTSEGGRSLKWQLAAFP